MLDTKILAGALEEMAAIPYFPESISARSAIGRQLEKFVSDEAKLRWLVTKAIEVMPKWTGIPEMRGLYCTRFKPADGVEAYCSLPGYRAENCEAAHALAPVDYKQLADVDRAALKRLE